MEMVIALNPLFEQVMVIGEGHPYLSALLILEPEQWQQLAQQHGLDPDAPQSLSDKRIHQWVIQHINRQLHHFPAYAKIRRVHLGLTPWSIDNGLMTPTMKIKRKQVLSHLVGEIEQLY
jgi:long-chain acyl-CoA synthetase